MGFEPMIQLNLYFGLANQRFKPLSHTSSKRFFDHIMILRKIIQSYE